MKFEHASEPTMQELWTMVQEQRADIAALRKAPRPRRFRRAALIAASGVAALGISTSVFASIPDPSGVIHGCYTSTGTHALQVIDTAVTASCPSGTSSLNWNQKGLPGLTWKGAWSSTATYKATNAVSYQGSSWIATATNTNSPPSAANSNWNLLAQQGAAGATGPQGPAGPVGATGPQGPQGPPGLSQVRTYLNSCTISANSSATCEVMCPTGQVATGGGYYYNGSGGDIEETDPVSIGQLDGSQMPEGWQVTARNGDLFNAHSAIAYAVCANAS